jgi:phosphate transport system substrate-binding protein
MIRLNIAAAAVALVAMASAAHAATVSVHGSTTVANAVFTPHKAAIETASGATLEIVANGSGRGLADLVGGKANIAMISAPLAEEAAKMNEKTPGSIDAAKLHVDQIGEAQVAFVVHPTNSVKSLTLAQVADVLSGKVKNWSELGGADLPIIVVAAMAGDGVRATAEGKLLGGASIKAQLREVPNANQIGQVVAQMAPALGVIAKLSAGSAVSVLKTDKNVGQPLFLVTVGAADADAAKVIAAATAAAAAAVN